MTAPELEEERKRIEKLVAKKIAAFQKVLDKAKKSLLESHRFDEARHHAELVKTHYGKLKRGMKELTVRDWADDNKEKTIPIDAKSSPKEVLEKLFKKSQKLERAIAPLTAHIEKITVEFERLQAIKLTLASAETIEALQAIQNTIVTAPQAKAKVSRRALPYHFYYSQSGIEILVGKNSESNHNLTFRVAHGSDLWLHAHAVSGAHVVVKTNKAETIDAETLQDALQLALWHSKAKNQINYAHEVLVTERKYVSRTPTAPKGKVLVSKHKIMTSVLDPERIKQIRQQRPSS